MRKNAPQNFGWAKYKNINKTEYAMHVLKMSLWSSMNVGLTREC